MAVKNMTGIFQHIYMNILEHAAAHVQQNLNVFMLLKSASKLAHQLLFQPLVPVSTSTATFSRLLKCY